jgi:hypothetical protein
VDSAAKGYILYNFTAHQALLPNILTLAGMLDAIPVEVENQQLPQLDLLFDVSKNWKQYSAL